MVAETAGIRQVAWRRRTGESIRRLLGLDMPVKVDATVTDRL
ncbi:hypothetical protein AB0L66_17815 [Streptomyces sp. NPDC052207]